MRILLLYTETVVVETVDVGTVVVRNCCDTVVVGVL